MQGDTWENNIKLGEGEYALNSKTIYTLMSVGKKMAVIGLSTEYQPIEDSKLKDISGTMTGTMEIDLNTGFPLGSETAQHMEMTLEEQGVKVPVKIDAKVRMEIMK